LRKPIELCLHLSAFLNRTGAHVGAVGIGVGAQRQKLSDLR
jgi:hypothetical protein